MSDSSTTNTQILNAIEKFHGVIADQTRAIDGLASEVQEMRVDMARVQTWRNGHEAAHKNDKTRLEKLENRTTLQGVIVGIGEIIVAAIAILWRGD